MTRPDGRVRFTKVALNTDDCGLREGLNAWSRAPREARTLIELGNLIEFDRYGDITVDRRRLDGYDRTEWPGSGEARTVANRVELFTKAAREDMVDAIAVLDGSEWSIRRIFPEGSRSILVNALRAIEESIELGQRALCGFEAARDARRSQRTRLRRLAQSDLASCTERLRKHIVHGPRGREHQDVLRTQRHRGAPRETAGRAEARAEHRRRDHDRTRQ